MFRCKARSDGRWGWLAGLVLLAGATGVRADESQALDQFLARLGLADLRLTHMEQRLARETAAGERAILARKLADAYAEELVSAADDAGRFGLLHRRVTRLLTDFPAARTPAVEVVLLQAEYQRAESLLLGWLEDRAAAAGREEAVALLQRIGPALAARHKELAEANEKAADALDRLANEAQRQAAEERLARQQAVAARADYFAGWSRYYLGVAQQDPPQAKADFTAAKEHFLRILDVADERNYEPVEAETLGLDSIWRCRAAIGLALSELGLKRQQAASRVFGWLRHASAPSVIRDQAAFWQFQGLLNAGLVSEAAQFAAAQVAASSGASSPGKSSLCIAAIRAGTNLAADQPQVRQQLEGAGIRGLAHMRQFETLDKLIEQYGLDDGTAADFQLAWLRGRRQYLAAERTKDADGFRTAAATLVQALAQPQARSDLPASGQARYYLGWARYRLEEFDAAGRLFQEAATVLRPMLPDIAVQAAWMHATCLVQLASKDKRHAAAATTALQAFKREYPGSEEAQRVDLLVARLRHTHADPEAAIRELAAIGPDEPTYLDAQFEICQLRYQLWSKAKANPAKAQPLAENLLAEAQRVLSLTERSPDDERRIKTVLLAVDVLQASPQPDDARIGTLLASVRGAAERLTTGDRAAAEYRYRLLQHAQRTGDPEQVAASAHWIAEHGAGTPFELPALVIAARAADQAAADATAPDRAARWGAAAALYARLVRLLGESPQDLAENKNSLAAASKLAYYDELLGRWPEAAARLARLAAAAPHDRRMVRRAGLASFRAGQYAESLEHWRSLLAGLESGSEGWLEAKYFQLACLEKTDRPAAQRVLKQFKVLFPAVNSATWQPKLAEIARQIEGT